ncbi:MOSC domain-containing protein [Caldimonas tepidiphila]|uniref:MOSC domain-containing protein n=1 Tax=Caldimonas tepidiphila TaxID=2315841 RepID=UPI00196B1C3A|nr:MOSC domain-containing protein [Caldimonas tepidiphila]
MPAAGSALAALFAAPMRPGRVAWIGLRPARREPVHPVEEALAVAGQGLEGDRYRTRSEGARQVTLVAAEHLAAIAAYLGLERLDPALLRRNVVTTGVNLLALKGRRFELGGALLEYSGECHPCSRMEETLGPGGYNAVRGHGGITARVLRGGTVRVGDALRLADAAQPPA